MKHPQTILIDGPSGPVRINQDDFNPEEHTEHVPTKAEIAKENAQAVKAAVQATQPATPAPSAPVTAPDAAKAMLVTAEGKKHFVVYADGVKVEDNEKIDPKGYANEGAAWEAILRAGQPSD